MFLQQFLKNSTKQFKLYKNFNQFQKYLFAFDAQALKQKVAKYELKTLENHSNNQQMQDVIYELTYKLESETKYEETERNLIIYLNLGDINIQGSYIEDAKEGLQYLADSLKEYEGDKDLKSSLLPQALHRLGGIALNQKEIELSENYYQQTIDVITQDAQSYGEDTAITIDTVKLLSNSYEKIGNLKRIQQQLDQAVDAYINADQINSQALPEKHPFALKVKTFLGDTLRKLDKNEKAIPVLEQPFQNIDITDKNSASLYSITSSSLALSLINLQQHQQAQKVLIESEEKYNAAKALITELNFANLYHLQALNLKGLNKIPEAQNKIKDALTLAEKVLPKDHTLMKQYLQLNEELQQQ